MTLNNDATENVLRPEVGGDSINCTKSGAEQVEPLHQREFWNRCEESHTENTTSFSIHFTWQCDVSFWCSWWDLTIKYTRYRQEYKTILFLCHNHCKLTLWNSLSSEATYICSYNSITQKLFQIYQHETEVISTCYYAKRTLTTCE